uniref:Ubiquitin fusion degradation protein 1 homolog n=1 Tax=Strongyloides papillosus TaxID=174720 RepID=A0A0N5CGG6_STREA
MLRGLIDDIGIHMLPYTAELRCFSMNHYPFCETEKATQYNYSGKIFLPASALDQLMRSNIEYPMMFKISNKETGVFTHCGVMEFTAEEGKIYLPTWMMQQLSLSIGQIISIKYTSLPRATYAKLQPQSIDFLEISDPRAVLERELAKYSCFTINDKITFRYNDTDYEVAVVELKPSNAVCVVECDINVDFAPPVGYVEPENQLTSTEMPEAPELPSLKEVKSKIFQGSGFRLDGKDKRKCVREDCTEYKMKALPDIDVNESYKPGKLSFTRYNYINRVTMEKNIEEHNKKVLEEGFNSTGQKLRHRR